VSLEDDKRLTHSLALRACIFNARDNPLLDDITYNVPADIRQAEIAAGKSIGQSFVIQSHEVQDCRVKIVN
jgi:hypothetical protein